MQKVDALLGKKKYTLEMLKPEHRELYEALEAKIGEYNEKFDQYEAMNPEDEGYAELEAEVSRLDAETTADETKLCQKINGFINGSANLKQAGKKPVSAPATTPVTPVAQTAPTPPPAPAPAAPQSATMPEGAIVETVAQVTNPAPGTPATPAVPIEPKKKESNNTAVVVGVGILLGLLSFGAYNYFNQNK